MFDSALPVQVRGLVRGVDLYGPALLAAGEDRLRIVLHGGQRPVEILLDDLEGIAIRREAEPVLVSISLTWDDVLELSGDASLAAAVETIEHRATIFPEVTRGLRGVGAHRTPDHDRFFGPLLAARRRAEIATGWRDQLDAFHGERLATQLERSLAALAAGRHPASPPDRRALEAVLQDDAAPLFECLRALGGAAGSVLAAEDALRLVRWRAWVDAVRKVFATADRCWLGIRPVLDAVVPPPPERPGLWSRLRRRGG